MLEYKREFLTSQPHIPGSGGLERNDTFESWLTHADESHTLESTKKRVRATQYLAFNEDGRLVGMIQLRHDLNDYLLTFGGHIGYSVLPSERRKGYASEMLRKCLSEASATGLDRVLVTCDEGNTASEKVILSVGGVLEDIRNESDTTTKKRFWVSTSLKV